MAYANLQDLLTGEGSRKAGGRWNPKGMRTLYFSLDPETALDEVLSQHRSQNLPEVEATPMTLAGLRVKIRRLLDLTDRTTRRLLKLTNVRIRAPWRPSQHAGQEALTQAIGRLAQELGDLQGMLVPSVARRGGKNLVLFPGRLVPGEVVIVNAEEFPVRRRRRHKQ
jgi:RES domain-containing protein